MGTHPNAPTRVHSTGQLLSEHLAAHPELVGEPIIERFGLENGRIPFLFKVLSFDKALPVQIHPNKHAAEHVQSESLKAHVGKASSCCHMSYIESVQTQTINRQWL